jgi:uncharacterized membrane protein YraQ (UPF0718 family)
MIRLLIVLAVIGLLVSFLFQRNQEEAKPEVLYQQQTRQAEALEQQLQDQAQRQLESIDEKTR